GYTFAGWQDVPETMPNHDVVIMGSYTVNSYNAVFIIDGEVIETLSVEYGAVINAPAAPEKEDYTFDGWSNLPETMPAHDIEVTGSYTYSVVMFNAVFMIDGETYATIPVEVGDPIELPAEPFREGYTFGGWQDIPETMPNHDIVINGSYTVNSYNIIFMIGDEIIDTYKLDYGVAIEAPEAPEKEGYTFDGWSNLPATMPATDLVINGNYTAILYRLMVYLNGEVYIEEDLAYGAEIVIPEPEVPEGWQFDGWDTEIPETMPAHNVIIYGTLSVISWVDIIAADGNDSLTVYDLNGVLLFKNAKATEIKDQLAPGVYIINGHKVMVK
ncbi:MAG: InlB B-repeat-containing protein, partial [Muribaculaceae bacterium]|nr:InlB B-repeat-containing protein [Muribaculaceae bacterium]